MIGTRLASLLFEGWADVFAQKRTVRRAIEQARALPVTCGRRTISRTICALGRQHQDWSADYKLFSRSKWEEEALFRPVIETYLSRYRRGPVTVALDDTKGGATANARRCSIFSLCCAKKSLKRPPTSRRAKRSPPPTKRMAHPTKRTTVAPTTRFSQKISS